MNKRIFRLVYNRSRDMKVPMAETARGLAGKSGAVRSTSAAVLAAAVACAAGAPAPASAQRPPVVFASKLPAPKANLPQPYGTVSGRTDRTFVANPQLAPRVSWTVSGNQGVFNQGDVDRVILNWDSFDIGAGFKVHFRQNTDPNRYVSALNRIWSTDPSIILGSLTADREVILVNANGVYFGRGARVDTSRFVATTLGISDAVFERGIRNVVDGSAVFSTAGTNYQPTDLNSAVSVEEGAEIRAAAGGDVLLIAPRVTNRGRIETPNGQTILAAGDRVYLMSSSDPSQRGLIVGVDPVKLAASTENDPELGIVENDAKGSYRTIDGQTVADSVPEGTAGLVTRINEIAAESGTINLVGLAVRQNGNLRATTAVKGANGTILLQAQASTERVDSTLVDPRQRGLTIEPGSAATIGDELGTVTLGAGSVTEVSPSSDGAMQLDSETFFRSRVRIEGRTIHLAGGSRITAPSGEVTLRAAENTSGSQLFNEGAFFFPDPDASRIVIDPGARLDVAGVRDLAIDGARNQGDLRLFRIELADSPVQRNGPLYRSRALFDSRNAAAIEVANVSGVAASVSRSALERSTGGGSIRIEGEGAIVIGSGAEVDISGGSLSYSAATLESSLLNYQGRTVRFDTASPDLRYGSLAGTTARQPVPAYVEGEDGGALRVSAKKVWFDGNVRGSVVEGPYQRDGRSVRAAPAEWTFGRQETNGGLYLAGIRLDASQPHALDPSIFSSPLTAALTDLPTTLDFRLAKAQESGVGRFSLIARRVEQPNAGRLDLGDGGAFSVLANSAALNGAYTAAGGSIEIRTVQSTVDTTEPSGDVELSAQTRLDTAGRWTNDLPLARGREPAPVQVAGGTIEVSAARSIASAPGSALDVSAGAWLDGAGKLKEGQAGTIALRIGTALPPEERSQAKLALGAQLRGYDFSAGGRLTLGVPELDVVASGSAVAGRFSLAPEFFSGGGFGSIDVSSFGNVSFKTGTALAPVLSNWLLTPSHRSAESGTIERAASAVVLDPRLAERKPVNLAFSATRPISVSLELPGSSVVVEPGASIALEPGAALSMQATRNIEIGVGGNAAAPSTIAAPGGSVALRITGRRGGLNPEDDPAGFVSDQAIWLGAGASVTVAGTAVLRPDAAGAPLFTFATAPTARSSRLTGTVHGGGTISLQAERGYVIAEPGSSLNLDGYAARLNFGGLANAEQVARPAGTLNVSSPEGFVLDGAISARGPTDAAGNLLADGGRLNAQVAVGGVASATQGPSYPDPAMNLRRVSVDRHEGVLAAGNVQPGDDLSAKIGNGIGYVSQRLLDSGFDAVRLAAGDKVQFEAGSRIDKRLSIELDAPAIAAGPGAQVQLAAPRVELGNSAFRTNGSPPADNSAQPDSSPAMSTRLAIDAQTIDIVGAVGLQGFAVADLGAARTTDGEVRLMGPQGEPARTGQLNFAGDLTIRAGQTYAASGARFTLAGLADSTIAFRTPDGGSTSQPPLSARGTLVVTATDIVQDGVLRQPFGEIELNASRQLTLGSNSITSVSGDGLIVPFGTTVNLAQWLDGSVDITNQPAAKAIRLTAPVFATNPGARITARGGGDLQAAEFFPGVGGSSDYYETPGLYAVLPDFGAAFAPRGEAALDQVSGTGLQIEITLPGSPLAPGRYTLLPARYALLAGSLPQGAYLVSRAPDQGETVISRPIRRDDGSVVVTGHLTTVGSATKGQPGERFVIEPPTTFAAKSEVRLTAISDLYADRARSLGTTVPLTPRDAGALQMRVGSDSATLLAGSYDLGAPTGVRAGQWDISSSKISVVDSASQLAEGTLGITGETLSASAAGSVLLGATRSTGAADGNRPSVIVDSSGASEVSVLATNRPIQVEELLLAATDRVDVANGVAIAAAAAGTQEDRLIRLTGPGAFVGISANPFEVIRTAPQFTTGSVAIGRNVQLSGGSVALDSTQKLTLDPSVTVQTGAFSLGAQRISVGGPSTDPNATVLDGAVLATVKATKELALRSYSSIDFVGVQDFAQRASASDSDSTPASVFERLTLDSPAIRGVNTIDGNGATVVARADLAATDVVLRNTSGIDAQSGPDGQGSVTIEARPPLRYGETGGLTIGPGRQQLGFASTELVSRGDTVLDGVGGLQAQGDLNMRAARFTAKTAAAQEVVAGGSLTLERAAGSRTLDELAGQGAQVKFSGKSIVQDATLYLPAGVVEFSAAGAEGTDAIVFAPGSLTYAGGFALEPQPGWNIYGDGGQVAAKATAGRIALLGTLDVSAARASDGSAGHGNAGRIALTAIGPGGRVDLASAQAAASGRLLGRAGSATGDLGGRLQIDAQTHDVLVLQTGSASQLDSIAVQAVDGGFTRDVDLRVRSGDTVLGRGFASKRIAIAADQGALTLNAPAIDARSDTGGVVQLAAGTDLVVGAGTVIDARSSRAGANGGDVLLASRDGRIRVEGTARVDATGDGAQDGRIVLRAPQLGTTAVGIDPINASNLAAGEVDIEAVRVYRTVTSGTQTRNINEIAPGNSSIVGSSARLGQNTVLADGNAFMANASAILTQLGVAPADRQRVVLRAGAEVKADGNLTIAVGDWALNASRPGGDAGFLTLRAAGNLNIANSLSDGFTTALATAPINSNARSWSYRLAGGADLLAANPLAVLDYSQGATETGNVSIAANKFVRTGAGSIEIAAGRDIVFQGSTTQTPGAVYVAGRKHAQQDAVLATLFAGQSAKPIFTEQGGRLDLSAQRDIAAASAPIQLINNWYWRSGIVQPSGADAGLFARNSHLGWWTQFNRFRQTAGSFGGGDVVVEAGRDVRNLAVMAPTSAWADSRVPETANTVIVNGGNVEISAGRDVLGGQYFAARGTGRIEAAGSVSASDTGSVRAPILAAMDADWRVSGRTGVVLAATINPTAVSPSADDGRGSASPVFFTYSSDSAVAVKSAGGGIALSGLSNVLTAYRLQGPQDAELLLTVAPPSLALAAFGGSVQLFDGNDFAYLFPSPGGDLKVYAQGDLRVGPTSAVWMADVDPASWPTLRAPLLFQSARAFLTSSNGQIALARAAAVSGSLTEPIPHAGLHGEDVEPARLHADGSIVASPLSSINIPKVTHVSAAEDITDLTFIGLHLRESDVSTITAGRNLTNLGTASGLLQQGPGELHVTAGRQIDLGQSLGISSNGRENFPGGPATGASIKVTAGAAGNLNLPAFESAYLAASDRGGSPLWQANRQALLEFVRSELNTASLDYDQALALFRTFPPDAQRAFASAVLANEFGNAYLATNAPSAAQFTELLRAEFERHRTDILSAGQAALASNQALVLPGNQAFSGPALSAYLAELSALRFDQLDLTSTVEGRLAALRSYAPGWTEAVARSLGSSPAELDALGQQNSNDPAYLRYRDALTTYSGPVFDRYRDAVFASEVSSAGQAASNFGVKSLPMRSALYDQGFLAAELAGLGNFEAQDYWKGRQGAFDHFGTLNMTQSSVITRRGGDIALIAPGGAINVGLKAVPNASGQTGVIAVGGGDVLGFAKNDFQVNDQRVFIVGQGDMTVWTSVGDIDSGRGANTAVGAPPLRARRTADGVVFEVPPTTTGSGLAILPDGSGQAPAGTIGLYPALGEILALDAFIRAPTVVVGSTVRGADNLIAASISGATAPIAAPSLSTPAAPPPPTTAASEGPLAQQKQEAANRSGMLTVELLGMGLEGEKKECAEDDEREECKRGTRK